MLVDFLLDDPIWIAVPLVFGVWAWHVFRKGGLRAALFGSTIFRTLGEVKGESQGLNSITVKVHRLSGATEGKAVGIELVSMGIGGYQVLPVTLSAKTANDLSELIRAAAGGSQK